MRQPEHHASFPGHRGGERRTRGLSVSTSPCRNLSAGGQVVLSFLIRSKAAPKQIAFGVFSFLKRIIIQAWAKTWNFPGIGSQKILKTESRQPPPPRATRR